ncbi:hypothetical protein CsSME_00027947 [Camellia sinensis var. sinensis]
MFPNEELVPIDDWCFGHIDLTLLVLCVHYYSLVWTFTDEFIVSAIEFCLGIHCIIPFSLELFYFFFSIGLVWYHVHFLFSLFRKHKNLFGELFSENFSEKQSMF